MTALAPLPRESVVRLFVRQARYRRIVGYFARLTLHIIWWELFLRRLGLGWWADETFDARYLRHIRRYRVLAVELGGVLIKVGQFLSTRVDILPAFVTHELSGLQDEVPAVPVSQLRAELERELGQPIASLFAEFDNVTLGAASLGQTHRATLLNGERVVVKVQRPGIERIVHIDLAALHTVTQWLKRYPPIARRANVEQLLQEFSVTLLEELDYTREAAHAARFRAMFEGAPGILIPQFYADLCTRHVLVMEDVSYIKISDYAAITAAGLSRADVAERLMDAYMHQIFEEGFFHADPHPGNLFVRPPSPATAGEWQLVFIDFGMVGTVTPEIRAAMREAVIAVALRSPARLVNAFIMARALLPNANLARIIEAQTVVFDRFWGKSMGELRETNLAEVESIANQFRDLMVQLPFQVPENLIYLGRTVSILSGMCTGLDPKFNLFAAVAPYAQDWLMEGAGQRTLQDWLNQGLELLRQLVAVPLRLNDVLTRLERGELVINAQAVAAEAERTRQQTSALNQLTNGLAVSTWVIAGTLLFINHQPVLGAGAWGLAALAWLVGVLRRG